MANEFVTRKGLISLGGVTFPYTSKTATYTTTKDDYFIDCTSGTFTINLISATGIAGFVHVIRNSGTGVITVDPDGAQTINGASTLILSAGSSITIESNDTNWITSTLVADNIRTARLELGVSSTATITTGAKGRKTVGYAGTIIGWRLVADASTTTVVDIWKANNTIPTVANTITASAKPSLSAAQVNSSSTLTGWTTSVAVGDVFIINVDSNNNATYFSLEIDILLNNN